LRPRGFTLIEVLVALAIVTVGMAAVLGALISAADPVFYLRDKTLAQWVALNQIATVRLQGQVPSQGKTHGEAEMAGRKWTWEQNVQPLQYQGIVRIDVSARPAEIPESKKNAWYATETGVMGNGVDTQPGNLVQYDVRSAPPQGTTPVQPLQPGQPSSPPGQQAQNPQNGSGG
jgi:general secretion pathway protein I